MIFAAKPAGAKAKASPKGGRRLFKIRLCRVGCMMRAVTAFLSSPLACGGDVQLGNPADNVDVVVVGAGWAGMASADHLRKAGVSFVVQEAQSHTGGRRHASMFGHKSVGQYLFEQGLSLVCGSCTERKGMDSPMVRANRVLGSAEHGVSKLLAFLAHVVSTCRITS